MRKLPIVRPTNDCSRFSTLAVSSRLAVLGLGQEHFELKRNITSDPLTYVETGAAMTAGAATAKIAIDAMTEEQRMAN
jgi:hypothetical protein